MTSLATTGPVPAEREFGRGRSFFLLGLNIFGQWLIALILVDALLEGWLLLQLQQAAGDTAFGPGYADLVKGIRNGAYVTLAVVAGLRFAMAGRIRTFFTPADGALVVLLAVLGLAGLAGGSSPMLIAEAVFVYLRGAIIFYAVRALDIHARYVRVILVVLGAIVVANAVVALAQRVTGPGGYGLFGITDLTWAYDGRAQGLFTHPNHLGHITGFAAIGVVAWHLPRISLRWYVLLGLLSVALGMSQSWESIAAVLLALGALALVQGRPIRKVALSAGFVATLAAAGWAVQPGAAQAITDKVNGVIRAIDIPSGTEHDLQPDERCTPGTEDCTSTGVPRRSTRLLLYQQGIRIWAGSPLLGYGVGQFGGGVASQHDPQWFMDPRFGPNKLNLYGMNLTQVDSFWLHLLVEAGALGLLAYLAWLGMIVLPSARRLRRSRQRGHDPDGNLPIDRWALMALVFGVLIGFLSPSLEDPVFPALLFGVLGLAWISASAARVSAPSESY